MKKLLTSCVLTAAAAGVIFAASDKIQILQNGYLNKSIAVDEIENISYTKTGSEEDFSSMKVDFKNGTSTVLNLGTLGKMIYHHSLGDCPLEVEVTPRYESAQLKITTDSPDTYYRISGVTESQLTELGIDESIWGETLVASDISEIKSVADYYGRPLSSFSPDDIFEKGDQLRDWFPGTIITDNTPIVIAIYTAELQGDEVVPTCEPMVLRFTTRKLEIADVDFAISAELKSNRITVKADAPEGYADMPFYIAIYPQHSVESDGIESLVSSTARSLENNVYNYLGGDWDQVVYHGHGENTFNNLCQGDIYYAAVFGLDYGIVNTVIKTQVYTIPESEVTDDCTFDATATQLSPAEYSIHVVPSNSTTRYAAMLIESSRLTEEYPASLAVAKEIHYRNYTGSLDWADSEFVFTGEQTLNTHTDLLEGKYLNIGTEYSVLIFGIDEEGTRTTAIKEVSVVPHKQQQQDLSFDVSFHDFDNSSNWTHYLKVDVTPSDPEARYTVAYYKSTNSSVNLDQTDEEWINNYVQVQGEYLQLYTGTLEKTMSFGSDYDYEAGGYVFKDYIMFIFGYDGEATSPLYVYRINTETGETEQLRGPKDETTLSFGIQTGEINASSSWTHYLPVTVTPSDDTAKYVFAYLPATNSSVSLDRTDQEFIANYVSIQGEYLELHTGTLEKTMSFSSSYDYEAGGYVFKDYIMFVFGYDGEPTSPLYVYRINAETGETEQLRGPKDETEELTFGIGKGEFNGSSNWTHYLPVTVTPSDDTAKYVFGYLPETNSSVSLDRTDQEFIANYVSIQGEYMELHTGTLEKNMSFSSSYDSAAGGYVFKDYIMFIFGYDGEATSPLYLYRINSDNGDITPIERP